MDKLFVTKPSLPELDTYRDLLESAWESGILTHNGPLLRRFESELKELYDLENLSVVINGTVALQLAIRALDLKGEIITTPFSWIATCSSIMWENCDPVFVDIDEGTFNIDPKKIEAAITEKTSAIMAVHVFSNPCDIEAIQDIADRHDLKVIYDGAHASNVNYKGRSIFTYGDISTVSFHATKLLNSGEGGACISRTKALDDRIKRLRFFGYDDTKEIVDDGCNGKMTELHAALGIANIANLPEVINYRKYIFDQYHSLLSASSRIGFQKFDPSSYNYSYMPVVFESEVDLLACEQALISKNIYPRRYFHPSLNTVRTMPYKQSMPVSESLASRILCLPSHNGVTDAHIQQISEIILTCIG